MENYMKDTFRELRCKSPSKDILFIAYVDCVLLKPLTCFGHTRPPSGGCRPLKVSFTNNVCKTKGLKYLDYKSSIKLELMLCYNTGSSKKNAGIIKNYQPKTVKHTGMIQVLNCKEISEVLVYLSMF
jgi:hypothetical protein